VVNNNQTTIYSNVYLIYIRKNNFRKTLQNNQKSKFKMSFKSNQLKNFYDLETHPKRVTRKDVSMEDMVRPNNSMGLSHFYSFTNPQMHERRPTTPLRFHRQMKFSQAAYHRNSFACYWFSKTDSHSGVVARHLFFDVKKFASLKTSTSYYSVLVKDRIQK
jgi:hypothetical protein